MNRFTILCTEEQTEKAKELGAPIAEAMSRYNSRLVCERIAQGKETREEYNKRGIAILGKRTYDIPTAEQMLGWLRSKNILFRFDDEEDYWSICDANDVANDDSTTLRWYNWIENKELKAIDAALEYLKSKN